jgi:hypothetical protein
VAWQELAVVVIVACAVAFLVRRVVGRRASRRKPAQTFVPLASLKRSKGPSDSEPSCH